VFDGAKASDQETARERETERASARATKRKNIVSRSVLLLDWGLNLSKREIETVGNKDV